MRTDFLIKKNRHYAQGINFNFTKNQKGQQYEFSFGPECWYPLEDVESSGVNKLCGFSYGLTPHNNSYRFGWQPDFNVQGKINIYAYYYINWGRAYYVIGSTVADTLNKASIIPECNSVSFMLNGDTFTQQKNTERKWTFDLYPYFGGESKAPSDLNIYLKRIIL